MQYQVEKIYPVIDTNREKGQKLIKIIQSQLSHLLVDSPEKADLIVVWGWDGYFMHSIKKYLSYKKPFFGVNCGTLWFLLNSFDSWEIFKKENIQVDLLKQLTLKAEITTTTWEKITVNAINDFVLWNSLFDYFKFNISLFKEKIAWTWLVISSTVWSTGYWKWLGWWYFPLTAYNLIWIGGIAAWKFDKEIISRDNFEILIEWRENCNVAIDGKMQIIRNIEKINVFKKWERYELAFVNVNKFERKRIQI